MFNENPELIITSLDKQIWDEELENFVPKNIFGFIILILRVSFADTFFFCFLSS